MNTLLRRLFSFALTVFLIGFVYVVFVYVDVEQKRKLATYPYVDCAKHEPPTADEAFADYQLEEGEKINLMECFCWTE